MLPPRRVPWALILRDVAVWGFVAGLLAFVLAYLFLAEIIDVLLR